MRTLASSNRSASVCVVCALALLLAPCADARGQQDASEPARLVSPPAPLAFDTVHLFPETKDEMGSGFLWWDLDSFWLFGNVSSSNLIANAYGLGMRQIIGLPQWAEIDRYSLHGSMSADNFAQFLQLTADEQSAQQRLMTQAVLADRYHLQAHRETRQMPVYKLIVGDGRPKISESHMEGHSGASFFMPGDWWNYGTMEDLACKLEGPLGAIVVDKTGLGASRFHYHLEWSQEEPGGAVDRAPSIVKALEKQLGLKLVESTAAVDILVIDHIEKPKTGFWQRASSEPSH